MGKDLLSHPWSNWSEVSWPCSARGRLIPTGQLGTGSMGQPSCSLFVLTCLGPSLCPLFLSAGSLLSFLLILASPSLISQFSSVQSLSRVRLFAVPWIAARQASLSITNSQSSLRLKSIESVIPSSHLILYCPLLLLPPILLSIRAFSNESSLRMRWPKYWSFSFNIIPSKEIPGLISFRMDWLDLLAVQGTLKSLLQHHSSTIMSQMLCEHVMGCIRLVKWYLCSQKFIIWLRWWTCSHDSIN